jgi:hypothetical protein
MAREEMERVNQAVKDEVEAAVDRLRAIIIAVRARIHPEHR